MDEQTVTEDQERLPLVSVITPVYNGEPYLEGVIRSVLDQDYPRIEHIVVDGGSTDGTLETIKRYAGKVRWDLHENAGQVRATNRGFSMSRGEVLGVVYSDGPLLPGAVSKMVEHLLANPDALVAYPDWLLIDGNGNTVRRVETHDYDYLDMLRWHHCMPGPGAFFRRSVLRGLGGRDPSFCYANDFDFWLRAGLLGPFVRVPQTLATCRFTSPGVRSASDLGLEMAEEHVRMVGKVFAAPNLPSEVKQVEREALSSAYYVAGLLCGEGAASAATRRYFLRALRYAPLKYLTEYRRRLDTMLATLLGRTYRPFRYVGRFFYRRLRAARRRLEAGSV